MEIRIECSSGKNSVLESTNRKVYSIPVGKKDAFVTLVFQLPLVNVQCHWNAKMFNGPEERLPWRIEQSFSFQDGSCFASFFNRQGENALSCGLLDFPGDVFFSALMNQEQCTYDITWKICFEEGYDKPKKLRFYLDETHHDWIDSLEEWRRKCVKETPKYPETAFDPVFCTWYAVHAAVTEKWCDKVAPFVRDLGFKTFILDDGWCYDESKRVTPETLKDWYKWVGDWIVSKQKFPHFKEHVKRLQKLGLNYLVWVAPFLIGTKSALYAKLEAENALQGVLLEGHRLLNPENPDACEAMLATLARLMKETGVDGLKVDFLDEVKSVEGALRGEACRRFITQLSARVRSIKSDALLEFRQAYTSMQMAPLATQFRAGDAPFDFMTNFKRLGAIRLCMGDRVPVHADPAYWHPQESPEIISCHCIAMLLGVPMLSMDPKVMGKDAARIVRRWLAFYEAHRATLNFGHWTIRYDNGQLRYASVSDGHEKIVILADSSFLLDSIAPEGRKEHDTGILLNLASPINEYGFFSDVEDCFGNALPDEEAPLVGGLARYDI